MTQGKQTLTHSWMEANEGDPFFMAGSPLLPHTITYGIGRILSGISRDMPSHGSSWRSLSSLTKICSIWRSRTMARSSGTEPYESTIQPTIFNAGLMLSTFILDQTLWFLPLRAIGRILTGMAVLLIYLRSPFTIRAHSQSLERGSKTLK